MDSQIIFLWMAGISCATIFLRALRTGFKRNYDWLMAAAVVAAGTGIAFILIPDSAGTVAGILWLLLILLPSLGARLLYRLTLKQKFSQACKLSSVLQLLHPASAWRAQPEVYHALALAQSGQLTVAEEILGRLQNRKDEVGRAAALHLYRLAARWEDALLWLQGHIGSGRIDDPSLVMMYVRALGECGQLDAMIDAFHQFGPVTARAGMALTSNLQLIICAISGQSGLVERLINGPLMALPEQHKEYWRNTALLACGDESAKQRFITMLERSDPGQRQAIQRRLDHPMQTISEEFRARHAAIFTTIENEITHEQYYGRGALPQKFRPSATIALLAVNLLMFVLEVRSGGSQNLQTIYELGAMTSDAVTRGEWWRLVAATFLHLGWLHLLMNMIGLLVLGPRVEFNLGHLRFGVIYLASGVGSMFAVALLQQGHQFILVGASGSIMALVGASAAIMLLAWHKGGVAVARRRLILILFIVVLQSCFDLMTPHVSMAAHVSGLVLGFLLGLLFYKPATKQ